MVTWRLGDVRGYCVMAIPPEVKPRCTVLFATSGAPFGVTELWFQPEAREVERSFDVVLLPTWPRGPRSPWPGRVLTENGRPRIRPIRLAKALVRSKELRSLLWSARDTYNGRTSGKCVLAFFVALQWAFELEDREVPVCHIHATTVASPAMTAAVIAEYLKIQSSGTAHRGDIIRRGPRRAVNALGLVRAISKRSQDMLLSQGCTSEVLKFGGLESVATAPVCQPSATLSIVAIGHLSHVKGHTRALKMLGRAKAAGVNFTLEIFGNGPLQQELLEEIHALDLDEQVHLRGLLPHDDLLQELEAGRWNVLIHPSREHGDQHEGLPVAILEAASNGLCIIASDSGGTPEFLTHGVNGLLFGGADTEEAIEMGAQALIDVARDVELQKSLGEQAIADADAYVASKTVARLREAIESLPPRA